MLITEVAHYMALLPLVMLAGLFAGGQTRDATWWWLASAFAVSWLADTAAHWVNPWAVGVVYPIAQAVIVAVVLTDRERAAELLGVLLAVGLSAVVLAGVDTPDIAVRSFAWLPLVWIAWRMRRLPARLRACLIVYFGLGWVAWLVHVRWLVVATWYPYQGMRLVGLLLFCWAAYAATPNPRLVPKPA
jgi:hypothetical protein